MLFYILFILTLLLILGEFRYPSTLSKGVKCFIGGGIITLMSSLRFDVGFDYFSYYNTILLSGGRDYSSEIISKLIMDSGYITQYPPLSFAIFSILTYTITIYILFKYSVNFGIAFFTFICFFFLDSLGIVRQGLAEAILIIGYPFVVKKKIIQFIFICLLASLVHKSALIGVSIYFIYNYLKFNISILIGLISIVFSYIIMDIIPELQYFGTASTHIVENNSDFSGGSIIMYIMPVMFSTLLVISRYKRLDIDYRLFSVLFLGASLPFIIGPHYGMRVSRYFNVYICFLLPEFLQYFRVKIRNGALAIMAAYFILFINAGWNKKRPTIAPYQTIFEITDIRHPLFKQP